MTRAKDMAGPPPTNPTVPQASGKSQDKSKGPTENAFVFDQIRGIYYPVHEKGTTTEGIVARALSKSQESIDFRDSKEMAIRWTLWAVAIGLALMLLALQIRRLIARS